MTELIKNLTEAGEVHKGSDLGALLQWAVLHIQAQDEALAEARKEWEDEANERIRLERAIHTAKSQLLALKEILDSALPINIQLARDHAPHINIMAHHGVAPYAKKSRKKKVTA